MKRADIWVEGIADQKFLADVLKSWFGFDYVQKEEAQKAIFVCQQKAQEIDIRVRAAGTVEVFISPNAWKKIEPDFRDNELKEISNIVIIDADDDGSQRRKDVPATTGALVPSENLFLWPDDRSNGDLENLLEKIINPEHEAIFKCWAAYETCLKAESGKNYTTPARKTKVYAYLEALLGTTKNEKDQIKERKRNYTNPNHWNLDPEQPALKPLYDFLKHHLPSPK
jgi:hypothetical protein